QPQRFNAQPLKVVWRRARLVSAAAQHGGSGSLDGASRGKKLLTRFHRTRPSDHYGFFSANDHTANVNLRAPAFYNFADKLERMRDGHNILHAWRGLERFQGHARSARAYRGHNGPLRAARNVRLKATFDYEFNYVLKFRFRRTCCHIDDHEKYS